MIDHQHLRLFSSVILNFRLVHLVTHLVLKLIFNDRRYMMLNHLHSGLHSFK